MFNMLVLTLIMSTVLLPAVAFGLEADRKTDPALTFGILYRGDIQPVRDRYAELGRYFSTRGLSVTFRFFSDSTGIKGLIEALKRKEVDVAGELSSFDYLRFERSVQPLVRSIWGGRDFYYSLFVVRKQAGVNRLADLAGRTVAFSNPDSTSGFVYPRALFYENDLNLEAKGLNNATKNGKTVFYRFFGSYSNVIDELAQANNEEIVAGAIPDFYWRKRVKESPFIVETLTPMVDGRSRPIKTGVFVHRPGLSADEISLLRYELIHLTESPPSDFFSDWAGFGGWIPWDEADYDGLRRALDVASPVENAIVRLLIIAGVVFLFISGILSCRWLLKKG